MLGAASTLKARGLDGVGTRCWSTSHNVRRRTAGNATVATPFCELINGIGVSRLRPASPR